MDEPVETQERKLVPVYRRFRRRVRRALLILLLVAVLGESVRRWGPSIIRELRYQHAQFLLSAGESGEAALELEVLIEGHPRETRARLALARAYRRQSRITEAEETLQRAVELGLPVEQARPEHDLLKASVQRAPTEMAGH